MAQKRSAQLLAAAKKKRDEFLGEPTQLEALVNSPVFIEALSILNIEYRERIFSPLWTLWVFLSQILNPDQSCQKALASLNALRVTNGDKPCSTSNGAYCKARKRLPESLFPYLCRQSSQALEDAEPEAWSWHSRKIKLIDGTTVSLPDTELNQKYFPALSGPFPMARIVGIFSLSNGSLEDAEIGPCKGKGNGECSLLMTLWHNFKKGEVLVFDRAFSTYQVLAKACADGLDVVSRLNATINLALHKRKKIGKDEWLLTLKKTKRGGGRYVDPEAMESAPDEIQIRLIKIKFKVKGFREKQTYLVTTLLDSKEYPKEEIAALYKMRWDAELDLRAIKSVMQMDVLRTKTPSMIKKEIWMHFTAYNLSEPPRGKPRGFTGSGRAHRFLGLTSFGKSSPCAGSRPFSA